tara:strand:+ start:27 stop:524 length:498 start_codon:yes stop_codon:yes gene_type:complete
MAYSGKFRIKNYKKYKGNFDNIIYRSLWEKSVFQWCDDNDKVKAWSSEETIIPYFYEADKKYHRYFPDVLIVMENKTILVEIKPEKETAPPTGPRRTKKYISEGFTYVKNMNKWEAAKNFCKDRGWEFQIWTEKTLQEMGLMHKPVPGKLKPLKRMKPYSRKRKK